MAQPVKIFYCYVSTDENALLKLEKQLKPLEKKKILPWHRRKLLAGTPVNQEIETHLNQTEIIILLVSSDFLNTDYSKSEEMKQALQLHREGKARVVPVILNYCMWQETSLGELQALPRNNKPISSWSKGDAAWYNVAMSINELVDELQKQAELEPVPKEVKNKTRKPTQRKHLPTGGPVNEAGISTRETRTLPKPRVIKPPQPAYQNETTADEEEPEPVTPEAHKATPEYDQSFGNLQNKINAIQLKILIWEPDTPTQGIVAEHRREIFHALEEEKHLCWLGKALAVPPGASLQDREVEQARQSDTTILLFETPALGEMSEFCRNEDVVEKTLVFYPEELKSTSDYLTLDKRMFIRFHLTYYQEQDIILKRILTQVLNWVMAQRSFRYSNTPIGVAVHE